MSTKFLQSLKWDSNSTIQRHVWPVLDQQSWIEVHAMSLVDDRITEIKASVQNLRATLRDAHGNVKTTNQQFADWREALMGLEAELRQLEDRL